MYGSTEKKCVANLKFCEFSFDLRLNISTTHFWFSKLYLHFEFVKFCFPAIKPTYALSIRTRFLTKLPAKLTSSLHMHSFNIRCMPHALVKITKKRCNYKIKKKLLFKLHIRKLKSSLYTYIEFLLLQITLLL